MTESDIASRLERFLSAIARIDAVSRHDLGLNANERMALLHVANGVTAPTDLSRHLGMTTAGTTNLLDRLVGDGYVMRERHATDGRRVLITLTKQGLRAHFRFQEIAGQLAGAAAKRGPRATAELARFLDDATEQLTEQAQRLEHG